MSDNNQHSILNTPLLIICCVGMVSWTAWFFLHAQLMAVAFRFAYWQFHLYQHLPLIPREARMEMQQLIPLLPGMNPADYNFSFYAHLWGLCAYGLRLFLVPVIIYLGARLPFKVRRFRYRRRLSMDQLIEIQSRTVYAVAVVKGLKLHKGHPHLGPWRVARNPLDFALEHGLLLYKGRDVIPAFTADQMLADVPERREILPDARYVEFDRKKADDLYRNQLGSPWRGTGGLKKPEMVILAAAFMARIAGEEIGKDDYARLMGTVAFSFKNPEWNNGTGKITKPGSYNVKAALTIARELIGKYESHRHVQAVYKRHGFDYTVLMGLLAEARLRSGKLPPSEFLWLKPVNRQLWYALHQVGGDTSWCESNGVWAHYTAEALYGRQINTPLIEGASDALEMYLSKEAWLITDLPDPELEQRNRMQRERGDQSKGAGGRGRSGGFGAKRTPATASTASA